MQKIFFLLILTILFSCKGQESKTEASEEKTIETKTEETTQESEPIIVLDVNDYKTQVIGKDIQLIDVRTADEYKEGHIDDAINIDYFESDTFAEKFEQFNKDEPLYIYCRSGGRSGKSSKILIELGFSKVYDLKGGYLAWSKQ